MSQTKLSPEDKSEADNRVADAILTWLSEVDARRMSIVDTFLAGYRAGYGHAKDDDRAERDKQR